MSNSEQTLSPFWVIHCDGSAFPNPGRMGLGAVMVSPEGERHTLSQLAEDRGCNNEAELRAVMAALSETHRRGARAVLVHSDNSIVVEQLTRVGVAPIVRLAGLFEEAREWLTRFELVSVRWVPRHRNGEADALARAALGMAPKPVTRPRSGAQR